MNIPENLDSETKKIIDKLANFVARNGPQFEEMTKQKQLDNPKFSFLFGGDFYTYYKFKVASEIAQMNQSRQLEQQQHQQQQQPHQQQQQHQQQQPHQQQQQHQQLQQHQQIQQAPPQPMMGQPGMPQMMGGNQWPANSQLQDQINQAQGQVTQLQSHINEQISQSETNLAAQYQALMQQQQAKIEETIVQVLDDELASLLSSCELTIKDLDDIVQPIIESCTKDAILNGKNWIMQRTSSDQFCQAVAKYFLKRITAKDAPFQLRLHLIYLINDVLHHCVRRNVEGLRSSLESVVMPIFCTSSLSAEEDKHQKLIKLLELWEKNKYFGPDTLEKMRDPSQALSGYQASLITENAEAVTAITSGIQQQYAALEKQHQEFVSHLNMQLQTAQQQLQALLNQANDNGPPASEGGGPMPGVGAQNTVSFPPPSDNGGYNQNGQNLFPGMPQPAPSQQPQQFEYNHSSLVPPSMVGSDMQGPPPNQGPPPGGPGGPGILPLPDFSKPPPGFPPLGPGLPPPGFPPALPPPSDLDLTPSVPYYELPAGLIAPLIRLEDFEYKPLDPKDIRLPPPMPPSERLLAAVEAFYQPPSRERPRDGDGWEKLGLYEFFRAKQRARKMKESRSNGADSPMRSPSASPRREFDRDDREDSPPRRRYNSEERRVRRSRSRSESRSRSRSRSRSVSRSPRRRSLKSRSRSRSRSGSPLPYMRSSRSRSPENIPRPLSRGRSPTPPSFGVPFHPPPDNRLGEDNKGHQLLRKMGWGGQGLGADEQGIVNPVEAAEVRDRMDMHKGIGIDLKDPFEQFRKNKSQGFIQRMKTRDDEKPRKRSKFND